MIEGIRSNLNTYYIGLLFVLAIYSAIVPDQGMTSFLAYYALSYIAVSTLALTFMGITIILTSIIARWHISEGILLTALVFLPTLFSGLLLLNVYAGLGTEVQSSMLTIPGILAFLLSLWSIINNPRQRINIFPEGFQHPAENNVAESIAVGFRKTARKLISAAVPGLFLSLFLAFAFVHLNPSEDSLAITFLFAIFMGPEVANSLVIDKFKDRFRILENNLVRGVLVLLGIAAIMALSFVLAAGLDYLAHGMQFYQKLSSALAITYLFYLGMYAFKIPKWFFDPALKGQDLEAFRNALLPEDRKKIDYAKVGQKVIIEQYGRKYAVEKKESDIRITPLEE